MYACLYAYTHVCICQRIYVCMQACIYIYIHAYIQKKIHKHHTYINIHQLYVTPQNPPGKAYVMRCSAFSMSRKLPRRRKNLRPLEHGYTNGPALKAAVVEADTFVAVEVHWYMAGEAGMHSRESARGRAHVVILGHEAEGRPMMPVQSVVLVCVCVLDSGMCKCAYLEILGHDAEARRVMPDCSHQRSFFVFPVHLCVLHAPMCVCTWSCRCVRPLIPHGQSRCFCTGISVHVYVCGDVETRMEAGL
jgi:hypothetical protein